jgi:hypothetical protein
MQQLHLLGQTLLLGSRSNPFTITDRFSCFVCFQARVHRCCTSEGGLYFQQMPRCSQLPLTHMAMSAHVFTMAKVIGKSSRLYETRRSHLLAKFEVFVRSLQSNVLPEIYHRHGVALLRMILMQKPAKGDR